MDFMIDFTPYLGLAVLLYAMRQTRRVPNRYIPILAVVLGVAFSYWQQGISPAATVEGLKYALYGIGTVAGVKYFLEKKEEKVKD
ncbi:phage holin family protein [Halobacillus litoralis]|uniref:phage holin family protein n=1 Tax=Halobacillus litoralis TaxID=45668 RepID=UPI001CFDB693|nr:phage holin family protein [Halobacillus litoralis]WLR47500.1 phage holin family protein [Halobacillus litoralis]